MPAALAAQGRLAVALLAGSGRVRRLARGARVEETQLGGVPASVFRPAGAMGARPALLVVPGVTRRGRKHPGFIAVGEGLAAAGFVVAVVEPPGLAIGELTLRTIDDTQAAAEELAAMHERVALAGVSGGATVALAVAAQPSIADRISAVAALAPCCDVRAGLRLVTTSRYRPDSAPFDTGPFFRLVIARSAIAWLRDRPDSRALREHVLGLEDYGPEPLRAFRSWPTEDLTPEARAVVHLLGNTDPERFDVLYAQLTDEQRRAAELLSPVLAARSIRAQVELVVAQEDKYIPLEDAIAFTHECPRARLTVVESLEHAVPSVSLAAARDLGRLDAAAVRFLAASYSA